MELHGSTHPFCHSCAGQVARMESVPKSIAAIRTLLDRERRLLERRGEGLDRRIFPRERRVGERRGIVATRSGEGDAHIDLPDFEDIVIELQASEVEIVEQTTVRESPRAAATE
jgi:hypothetical protein